MTLITVDQFNALPLDDTERAEALEWLERACPGCWTFDMKFTDFGDTVITCIPKAELDAAPDPFTEADFEALKRTVVTEIEPPQSLIAMVFVAVQNGWIAA